MISTLLSLSVPVFSLAGITWYASKRLNLSPYVAPLSTISGIVTVLYLSDFLSLMRLSSLILLIGGLFLFAKFLLDQYSKGGRFNLRRKTWGLLSILTVGLLFLFDLNNHASFTNWDEFSHWGTVIKLISYAHTFNFAPQSINLYFQDYPPGTALFAYYFLRATGYSEPVIYFSHSVILVAACLPVIGAAATVSFLRAVIAVIVSYLLIVVIGQGWSSVLVDQSVAVLFGGALSAYWLVRDKPYANQLAIVPVLCFLVLTKQSGNAFSLLFAILVSIDQAFVSRANFINVATLRRLVICLIPIWLIPQIISKTWEWHVTNQGLTRSFSNENSESLLVKFISCCRTDHELTTIANFFQKFIGASAPLAQEPQGFWGVLQAQIFRSDLPMLLTQAPWNSHGKLLILFLVLLILAASLQREGLRLRLVIFSGSLIAGASAYIFSLLLYYLYAFSEHEGRNIASIDRYLSTFELAIALFIATVFLSVPAITATRKMLVISLSSLLVGQMIYRNPQTQSYLYKGAPTKISARTELQQFLKPFISSTPQNTSAFLIWQSNSLNETGLQFWIMHYEVRPRNTNSNCFSLGPPRYSGDIWSCNWSEEVITRAFNGYHYVIVANDLGSLRKLYPNLFGFTPETENSGIFEVVRLPGMPLKLKPLSNN